MRSELRTPDMTAPACAPAATPAMKSGSSWFVQRSDLIYVLGIAFCFGLFLWRSTDPDAVEAIRLMLLSGICGVALLFLWSLLVAIRFLSLWMLQLQVGILITVVAAVMDSISHADHLANNEASRDVSEQSDQSRNNTTPTPAQT
jgi:hypothetical protein